MRSLISAPSDKRLSIVLLYPLPILNTPQTTPTCTLISILILIQIIQISLVSYLLKLQGLKFTQKPQERLVLLSILMMLGFVLST